MINPKRINTFWDLFIYCDFRGVMDNQKKKKTNENQKRTKTKKNVPLRKQNKLLQ